MLNSATQDKPMKVFGYVRLSRDEDKQQNSLTNQKDILIDYAHKEGYTIDEIFEDDNISGLTFDRPGLNNLKDAIENNLDCYSILVLVKDLSRLGRHKAYTALFLDELRSQGVKVYSVTENINNFNENDDLIIGIKQILNEQYAKDISRKVRSGFRQKQMKEGLVMIPPFGYIKNEKEIEIHEECAEIVKLIYNLYIDGYGTKKIAQYLTENNYNTPAWYQKQIMNKNTSHPNKKWVGKNVWSDRTVLRILTNEAYIGTLRCGTTERSIIYGYRRLVPEDKHFVHEDFYPPIIKKQQWDMAQIIRENRSKNRVRASQNSRIHRYAGLLECADCGACFVAKRRKYKKGSEYIEYVCNGYHRFGTSICDSHRVKESELDDVVYAYLYRLKDVALDNLEKVDKFIQEWRDKKRDYTQSIEKIQCEISNLKEEIKAYARQSAKHLISDEIFQELTHETNERISLLEQQIETLDNAKDINKNARLAMQNSFNILEEILKKRKVTDTQLQMLINKITIKKNKNDTLSLDVNVNTPFKHHLLLSNSITEATSTCGDDYSVIELINQFSYLDKIVN